MSTAATGEAAEGCDGLFEPDVRNCFVSFPKGEIGLLSANDNEVIPLFLPEDVSEAKQDG